jgi:hypothetical protein
MIRCYLALKNAKPVKNTGLKLDVNWLISGELEALRGK